MQQIKIKKIKYIKVVKYTKVFKHTKVFDSNDLSIPTRSPFTHNIKKFKLFKIITSNQNFKLLNC